MIIAACLFIAFCHQMTRHAYAFQDLAHALPNCRHLLVAVAWQLPGAWTHEQ